MGACKRGVHRGWKPPRAAKPILRCAYTGKPITIITIPAPLSEGGLYYKATGMFLPDGIYKDKNELLFDLSMRDGVPPKFPRHPRVRVRAVEAPPMDPGEDQKVGNAIVDQTVREVVDHVLPKA